MVVVKPRYTTPTGVRDFARALGSELPASLKRLRRIGRAVRATPRGARRKTGA